MTTEEAGRKITEDERRLLVEIGYYLSKVTWEIVGESDPSNETKMYFTGISVFDLGVADLRELGIVRRVTSEERTFDLFEIRLENVRDYLEGVSLEPTFDLNELVGDFLRITDHHGDLSNERVQFAVRDDFMDTMAAFVKLGYATIEPDGFRWTEKIAPIMIAQFLWTTDQESFQTLDDRAAETLAEKMWAALPKWRRRLLAKWIVGKSEQDLFIFLFRRWNGKRFRFIKFGKGKVPPLPGGYHHATRYIAKRLLEL